MINPSELKEGYYLYILIPYKNSKPEIPFLVDHDLVEQIKVTPSIANPVPLTPEIMGNLNFIEGKMNGTIVKNGVILGWLPSLEKENLFDYLIMVHHTDGTLKQYTINYLHQLQYFNDEVLLADLEIYL